jgi:hypothetical protein
MDIGGVPSVSWMEGASSHTRMNVCMYVWGPTCMF